MYGTTFSHQKVLPTEAFGYTSTPFGSLYSHNTTAPSLLFLPTLNNNHAASVAAAREYPVGTPLEGVGSKLQGPMLQTVGCRARSYSSLCTETTRKTALYPKEHRKLRLLQMSLHEAMAEWKENGRTLQSHLKDQQLSPCPWGLTIPAAFKSNLR